MQIQELSDQNNVADKAVVKVHSYGEVLQQIKLKCVMTFPISLMTFVTCIMTLTS